MRKSHRSAVGFVILLGMAAVAVSGCRTAGPKMSVRDLPPTQPGFHWEVFGELEMAVPCPDRWHLVRNAKDGVLHASLSPENQVTVGSTVTRFSIERIPQTSERIGKSASSLAISMAQEIADTPYNQVLGTGSEVGSRGNPIGVIRFASTPPNGEPLTCHMVFDANEDLDMLTIYSFVCPTRIWDEVFPRYGKVMLEQLMPLP